MQVRIVQPSDYKLIVQAYDHVIKHFPKSWFHLIDREGALFALHNLSFIVEDTYLVIISVEQPWYFNKPVLVEQVILKINKQGKGTFKDVLDFLDQEAKGRGCIAIFAGSMLAKQYKAMNKLYESGNYELSGNQFIKLIE